MLSHVWHHFLSNLFFARIFLSVDKITHFFPFSRKEKHHQIEQLSKHLRYFEIDTGNSKSDLKIKEASHINCRITTKLSSHPFTTSSVPPCFFLSFFVVLFCFYISLSSIIFISLTLIICIFYCLHYPSLLLDHYYLIYNTPCMTSFSLIYCFYHLYANYQHLLLS